MAMLKKLLGGTALVCLISGSVAVTLDTAHARSYGVVFQQPQSGPRPIVSSFTFDTVDTDLFTNFTIGWDTLSFNMLDSGPSDIINRSNIGVNSNLTISGNLNPVYQEGTEPGTFFNLLILCGTVLFCGYEASGGAPYKGDTFSGTLYLSIFTSDQGSVLASVEENVESGPVPYTGASYGAFEVAALPSKVTKSGAKQFNFSVTGGQLYYVDPPVVEGYSFSTGAGDPNFASVLLPAVQSNAFDLSFTWDGIKYSDIMVGPLTAYSYSFPYGGVDAFTVTGIDRADGLDPSNTSAFVTGLTFENSGTFTGTQTPITAGTTVPEPSSWAMMLLGFAGLGYAGYRKTKSAPTAVAA